MPDQQPSAPHLSVAIHFFNEEESIITVCEEVREVLDGKVEGGWELIMVDDGSTDRTPELIGELCARYPHFRGITLAPNSGQSAAMEAGFRAARGKIIANMDGDGQNDPRDFLPLLEEMARRKVDMMCGVRAKRADNWFRRFSSRFANGIRSWLLEDNITDVGCSLRVFRRSCFRNIGFFRHAHRYFPALFIQRGYKVAEMPVNHRPRRHGTSKYGKGFARLWAGIVDIMGVYWLKKRAHRYRVREVTPRKSRP